MPKRDLRTESCGTSTRRVARSRDLTQRQSDADYDFKAPAARHAPACGRLTPPPIGGRHHASKQTFESSTAMTPSTQTSVHRPTPSTAREAHVVSPCSTRALC